MAEKMQHNNQELSSAFGRPRSRTMEDVARYIGGMKFKKRLFGGVDEADVWRQIEALHAEYEAVFLAQELRYEQQRYSEGGQNE